jgi:hypothetical protein
VNTNETLDGVTAGFIATVANSLSRNIGMERMKELIKCPRKMALLLIPLIDDSYASVIPSIFKWVSFCQVPREENIITFYPYPKVGCGPATFRMVMKEAYERKYAPLSFTTAKKLFDLLSKNNEVAYSGFFPFFDSQEKLWILGPDENILVTEDFLDKMDRRIIRHPFFFTEGFNDRSNCFKC